MNQIFVKHELDWARDQITEALSELQVLARLRDLVTRALSEYLVLVRDLVTEWCQRSSCSRAHK